jgi:cell division protein FtsB
MLLCTKQVKTPAIKSTYTLLVLSGVVYAFIVLRGPNGLPGLYNKREQIRQYEQANQKLQREIEEKQERIQRLQENEGELDYEIRQRLKLAKPGEKIFVLEDKKK